MRATLVMSAIVMAFVLLAPTPSYADPYPWCAEYGGGGRGGGRNCGFVTWEQCMATARGMGGFCQRNLFYTGPETPVRRYKKKTVRRYY